MTKENKPEEQTEGVPICEKCGNAMIKEDSEWMCPHCQGEIDFTGGEDYE